MRRSAYLARSRSLRTKRLIYQISQLPKILDPELDTILLQRIHLAQPFLSEHIIPVHPYTPDPHLPARLVVMEQALRNVHMLLLLDSEVRL